MTDSSAPSDDRHAHLRTYAAMQKQATVDRLKQAIVKLEAESRPVNTFTIKEVSGLDYMAYYRNREAFALFQQHSTHLQKAREKEQAKQRGPRRPSKRKDAKDREALHKGKVSPRDPLLDYKRPRLVELLHEARAERDQIKQQAQEDFAQMEQRYHALLQERMQCGLTIARLEAQVAEYLAFMNRFRTSLQREEHGPAT
jgi:hypothetical protein